MGKTRGSLARVRGSGILALVTVGRSRRNIGLLVLAVSLMGGVAWGVSKKPVLIPERGAMPGLRVGGAPLTPGQDIRAHVAARAVAIEGREVTLKLPDGVALGRYTFEQLGLSLEVDQVSRRGEMIGRAGCWAVRGEQLLRARRGELDVPLVITHDGDRLARLLAPHKERLDTLPRPARFNLDADTIVEDTPGRFMDVDPTVERLIVAARTGAKSVEIAVRPVRHRVSSDLLRKLDRSQIVSEFSTRFSRWGDGRDRAVNIETAARKLDGVVLAPGEVVSFNRRVGARTLANGFRQGWEIYKGEMVRGIGGGTCQVSSTLHAAAVYGGLDIVERYPHSRPSKYISLGLDSTVSWPSVDLKIQNPWTFPIVIDTEVVGGQITVRLLGEGRPAQVSWKGDTLEVIPYDRKVTESGWLAEGTIVRKRKGIRGFKVRRVRTLELADGSRREEVTLDLYPPTHEHFIVPRGTDVHEALPPPAVGSKAWRRWQAAEAAKAAEDSADDSGTSSSTEPEESGASRAGR